MLARSLAHDVVIIKSESHTPDHPKNGRHDRSPNHRWAKIIIMIIIIIIMSNYPLYSKIFPVSLFPTSMISGETSSGLVIPQQTPILCAYKCNGARKFTSAMSPLRHALLWIWSRIPRLVVARHDVLRGSIVGEGRGLLEVPILPLNHAHT